MAAPLGIVVAKDSFVIPLLGPQVFANGLAECTGGPWEFRHYFSRNTYRFLTHLSRASRCFLSFACDNLPNKWREGMLISWEKHGTVWRYQLSIDKSHMAGDCAYRRRAEHNAPLWLIDGA